MSYPPESSSSRPISAPLIPIKRPIIQYGSITPEEPNEWAQHKICRYGTVAVMAAITLALFLLLWFVPTLAERSIDQHVLFTIQQASILNVTQNSTMWMHVVGQIQLQPDFYSLYHKATFLTGPVDVHTSHLTVYFPKHDDTLLPIGTMDMPALTLTRQSSTTDFDFTTEFIMDENTEALVLFCRQAVMAKAVEWKIRGPLSVSLGWIPWISHPIMDKTISLEGMDGLQETDVASMVFPGLHESGGVAVEGKVGIRNPSHVLSFYMGDMDFGIYLPGDSTPMAVVRAYSVDLSQGMNYFRVSGHTMESEHMDDFLSGYVQGNATWVHVRILGGDVPEWLSRALSSITLGMSFPGCSQTDLIQSLGLSHIQIDFTSTGKPLISGDAVAVLDLPSEMEFTLDIATIDPQVYLYLDSNATEPFGYVHPPRPAKAHTTDLGNHTIEVTSRLSRAPFTVLRSNDFKEFMNRVFHKKNSTMYMRGTVDCSLLLPHWSLRDIPFNGEIHTQGMEGLLQTDIKDFKLIRGYPDTLHATTTLTIYSPSDISVDMGEVHLLLVFNGHVIGNATVPSLQLAPNTRNTMTADAYLYADTKDTHAALLSFMSQYISQGSDGLELTISGDHPTASSSAYLLPFLRTLDLTVSPPVFDKPPLLADVKMNLLSSTIVLSLSNPFEGITLSLITINATAHDDVCEIGHLSTHFTHPLLLPPPACAECDGNIIQTEKIPIVTKKLGYEAIKKALGGSLNVTVNSIVDVKLGQFLLSGLIYDQKNITARVRKGF